MSLGRVILYVRDMDACIRFYREFFGYTPHQLEGDRLIELTPPDKTSGASILLHPAGKTRKQGQTQLKLVFDVPNVEAFLSSTPAAAEHFGPLHRADGYVFSNAMDPAGNSVQISSWAFVVPSPK
ncbi:MAG: catechol 2,3-dioxygenase-like lactoylglutathione lyase family enzyme [Gammaproteobacteria bacterium]|jgi:catechol 2,3-dioxygenase-like lactoylglutathione lyase family enzyme